jgi:hypothetical protein
MNDEEYAKLERREREAIRAVDAARADLRTCEEDLNWVQSVARAARLQRLDIARATRKEKP